MDDKGRHKRLTDIEGASAYTGLSVHTIYTMVSQRRIPHVKLGKRVMFDLNLLDRWIEQNTIMPMRSGQA
jgi:excisionase family DNA binding protein